MSSPPKPESQLVLTFVGNNDPKLMSTIAAACANSGSNIAKCRSLSLGKEYAAILLIVGAWDALAKLETSLPNIEKEFDLALFSQRTEPTKYDTPWVPYTIQVVAVDKPGIISNIAQFCQGQGLLLEEVNTETYPSYQTQTLMFSMSATLLVPADTAIANLRERFIIFCDDLNLDAILEPFKG